MRAGGSAPRPTISSAPTCRAPAGLRATSAGFVDHFGWTEHSLGYKRARTWAAIWCSPSARAGCRVQRGHGGQGSARAHHVPHHPPQEAVAGDLNAQRRPRPGDQRAARHAAHGVGVALRQVGELRKVVLALERGRGLPAAARAAAPSSADGCSEGPRTQRSQPAGATLAALCQLGRENPRRPAMTWYARCCLLHSLSLRRTCRCPARARVYGHALAGEPGRSGQAPG